MKIALEPAGLGGYGLMFSIFASFHRRSAEYRGVTNVISVRFNDINLFYN